MASRFPWAIRVSYYKASSRIDRLTSPAVQQSLHGLLTCRSTGKECGGNFSSLTIRTFVTSSFNGSKPDKFASTPNATETSSFFDSSSSSSQGLPEFVDTATLIESTTSPVLSSAFADGVAPVLDTSFLSELPTPLISEGAHTLREIGLGCYYTPVGWLQHGLEFLHTSVGMPWWVTIIAATVVARTLVFPLVIKSQKNVAKMSETLPEMQRLQKEVAEAQARGDIYEYTVQQQKLGKLMQSGNLKLSESFGPLFAQIPIFMSYFIGLRNMANAPVDSFRDGGTLWFLDLTASDPTYLLPIFTAVTLHLTIRVGADGTGQLTATPMLRYFMLYGLPLIIFPATKGFASAILLYWLSSNVFSFVQVLILRIKPVRDYFQIPERKVVTPLPKPVGPDGNPISFKESFWKGIKGQAQAKDFEVRLQMDESRFRNAGFGPVPKTFKYDPTKPRPVTSKLSK